MSETKVHTSKIYRAIGLMSGTSLDAVDAALIETDGHDYIKPLEFMSFPYTPDERREIKSAFGRAEYDEVVSRAEELSTQAHIRALKTLGWKADIIGYHGQTIYHAPDDGTTVQIGNGAQMAEEIGIDVVDGLRKKDVEAGGQGAPLLPIYHYARMKSENIELPVAVLNIGGVGNVTYLSKSLEDMVAFDTGPGNALMDDFVLKRVGSDYDKNGELAFRGKADQEILKAWMDHPYFKKPAPKSLDRDAWDVSAVEDLSTEDGVATLAEFTIASIISAHELLLSMGAGAPRQYYVGGGGRHNEYLMQNLSRRLEVPFKPVEALAWNGDALEAKGFAYMAVRSLLGEPITFPGTTGVSEPVTGGVLHRAKARAA